MTIFDKISGFAQKAKDNALSRAVLAKDKRLDKSMSESIQAAHIGLLKMATYGVSGTVSAVAFDPVAGLLAVGGGFEQDTFIRLFGRGISAELVLNNPTRIKYLQFKIGYPILVAVDMKNVITTYDLKTKRAKHVVTTPSIITALEYCSGTDWLFVGFSDGNVDVFDITKGRFSEEYGIPDLLIEDTTRSNQQQESTKTSSLVVALQMHPTDLSLILIGYESAVYLWNIREQSIKKRFSIQSSQLTCLAWSPCGNRFMAGYDDGYMRLWDTRSDHKPVLARRAFHASPSTSPSSDPCEPIYRMVWYVDDTSKRSFLVVAGGSDLPDIRGLHIMEFDIESDQRDARRQTILSTSVDVSDFILLSRDPYFLGMQNPLGLLVVGCDGAIRAYGLGHGYPQLTLPSALQFLDPPVSDAYHFTQLPESTFQRINAIDQINMPPTHYLPLTGGVAGKGHVYRLDSNDLLITIHAHRIIHIWDASYTSLRPLTHLTIDCIQDIQDSKAKITQVEFDTQSASLFVALDNGTVLQYTHHPPRDSQHQLSQTTQEAFIKNCDNTIEEISELLKDMETEEPVNVEKDDDDHTAEEKTKDETSNNDSIPKQPPTTTTTTEDIAQEQQQQDSEVTPSPSHIPEPIASTPDIQLLEGEINPPCFAPAMQIKFTASVKQMVAAGGDMLAVATSDGKVFVINTLFGRTVYTTDIQAETEQQEDTPKEEDNEEHNQKPKPTNTTASISSIRFYKTYASLESTDPSLQLFVGWDNGFVYQHDINSSDKPPILVSNNSTSAVIDTHVLDMQGVLQVAAATATTTTTANDPEPKEQENQAMESHPSTSTTSPEEENSAVGRKSHESGASWSKDEDGASNKSEKSSGSMGLLRRTTRKLSKPRANKEPAPPLPTEDTSPPSASTIESSGGESATQQSKRAPHSSKWEYRPQPSPHFIVVSTSKSIATVLSGYNIRLFTAHLHDIDGCNNEDTIIHSQVMMVQNVGACLAVVLQSGVIIYYSLPHLLPIARISLPNELAARDLLENMSLSTDGRIVAWTGLCELEQYLSLLQNSISCGEDVMLFDPGRRIPPHPTATMTTTQKPKKSWLESVQGAFQKGPFTVAELDELMGKKPILGASNKATKSTEERPSNAEGSGSGLGGVFQELSQKMNERGEKLDQLQNKFEDMSAQSGDFLKAVREYNERQARKKWWEF